MSFVPRGTRAAARSLRAGRTVQQPRRCVSSGHGHDHAHGHGESALHLPNANRKGNESLGSGFYITLASVPVFYVFYSLAYGSEDNYFARQYLKFKEGKKDTADRDLLHETVLRQAIEDRARMKSYPRETAGPDLRYPEMFNMGSPWNLAAGNSAADLKTLEQYYNNKHAAMEEDRVARMKDGKVQSVYER